MKNLLTKSGWLAIGALGFVLGFSANADILFKNATVDRGIQFNPGTAEIGNQIYLSNAGYITNFAIEYWGTGPGGSFASSLVQMRVRWYLNDGAAVNGYASPGTLEFDSNWNTITATNGATLSFGTPPDFPVAAPGGTNGLFIPSRELTVTVQFQGMASGDAAGLELFGPVPTTGDQFADYWLKNVSSSSWQLLQDTNNPVTFGEEWMGTPVPEPSTLAISLVGGVGLFLAVRRFRK